MPLEPKSRLGGFEILETLGAGGMGEVYRARDTHLKREVAIKILHDSHALDPQRVARFEREAVLLASLSHPNIATLYGLEKDGDVLFLVLDLVKGSTLAEKMQHGPLPLREALDLFRQVAAGLGAAHERGIIHRDLKPANVKVTPQGLVKVLDFGLAKELLGETPLGPSQKTETAPDRMTREGDILGTLAYMSPEQARGQSLDKRTDIWSFGVCFFEALSGRHPFDGKTSSDILAAVISTEPDFGALPTWVPRNIRHLLQRCLRKELHRRLHDIEDARLEIEEALEGPPELAKHEMPTWGALVLAAACLLVGFGAAQVCHKEVRTLKSARFFTIEVPPTEPVALEAGPPLALSPDGMRLVYTARRGDMTELRLRAMDRLDPTPLPGTAGASSPFFSPDGNALGFFSEGKLHRMSLSGFAVESMIEAPSPRGASWGSGGIVLAPFTMGGLSAIGTGNPTPVGLTTLGEETRSHRWPTVLPDGEHVLFTSLMPGGRFRIEVVAFGGTETRVAVEDGSYARYSPTGHLVFARGPSLMAARFDPRALEIRGAAVEMLSGVGFDDLTGASFYDLATDGTLVFVPEGSDGSNEASGRLLRIDRNGGARLLTRTSRGYQVPRLSPSGDQLLVTDTVGESTDIYLLDIHRGSMRRVTFEGNSGGAIWKPDGREITFGRESDGIVNLFAKAIDASSPAVRLTTSPNPQFPNSWSPDGSHLAFTELSPDTQFDVVLWLNGRSEPFLATSFNESAAMFSPDGRYLAYVSDENGTDEIYVREFPSGELKGRGPISTEGGHEPVWGRNGEELFYRDEDSMMVVSIETQPEFRAEKPRPLFEAPFDEAGAPYASYDITRDGNEFIMVQTDRGSEAMRLHVVVDWFSELERRVPYSP